MIDSAFVSFSTFNWLVHSNVIPSCTSVYNITSCSYFCCKRMHFSYFLKNVKIFSTQYFYYQMNTQQLFEEFSIKAHKNDINKYSNIWVNVKIRTKQIYFLNLSSSWQNERIKLLTEIKYILSNLRISRAANYTKNGNSSWKWRV